MKEFGGARATGRVPAGVKTPAESTGNARQGYSLNCDQSRARRSELQTNVASRSVAAVIPSADVAAFLVSRHCTFCGTMLTYLDRKTTGKGTVATEPRTCNGGAHDSLIAPKTTDHGPVYWHPAVYPRLLPMSTWSHVTYDSGVIYQHCVRQYRVAHVSREINFIEPCTRLSYICT